MHKFPGYLTVEPGWTWKKVRIIKSIYLLVISGLWSKPGIFFAGNSRWSHFSKMMTDFLEAKQQRFDHERDEYMSFSRRCRRFAELLLYGKSWAGRRDFVCRAGTAKTLECSHAHLHSRPSPKNKNVNNKLCPKKHCRYNEECKDPVCV